MYGLPAKPLCLIVAALSLLSSAALAQVQINQNFVPQGPSPSSGPLDIVGSGDAANGATGTVAGAVQAILLDPMLGPNTMFIGSPNGGIWETTNGGTTWTPLTDHQASLSIASLALDPTDSTGKTLIAGIGITSSGVFDRFNRTNGDGSGGLQTGLLLSTDGGKDWTPIGATTLAGQSVIGVAATGSGTTMTIMAATFEEGDPTLTQVNGASYGLYISTNSGTSFKLVQPTCGLGSGPCGLPAGPVTALVADPSDPSHSTFYAAVTSPATATSPAFAGVYVTTDSGLIWSPVHVDGKTDLNVIQGTTDQLVLKLAAGPNGSLAIGVADVSSGTLTGLYLSQNASVPNPSWSALAVPPTNPAGGAVYKLAMAIDPSNTKIVYVSGDAANINPTYPAPVFSVQANQQPTSLTCPLSPSNLPQCTTPPGGPIGTVHADSRALVINPVTGNLLMGGDGGIYLLTDPQSNTPTWSGLNSTLQIREVYAVAYGANAHESGGGRARYGSGNTVRAEQPNLQCNSACRRLRCARQRQDVRQRKRVLHRYRISLQPRTVGLGQ